MNTPIWKHIKLTNKSCIGTLLAVLISMFVNMDMYGQLYYINGSSLKTTTTGTCGCLIACS